MQTKELFKKMQNDIHIKSPDYWDKIINKQEFENMNIQDQSTLIKTIQARRKSKIKAISTLAACFALMLAIVIVSADIIKNNHNIRIGMPNETQTSSQNRTNSTVNDNNLNPQTSAKSYEGDSSMPNTGISFGLNCSGMANINSRIFAVITKNKLKLEQLGNHINESYYEIKGQDPKFEIAFESSPESIFLLEFVVDETFSFENEEYSIVNINQTVSDDDTNNPLSSNVGDLIGNIKPYNHVIKIYSDKSSKQKIFISIIDNIYIEAKAK